MPSQSLTPKNGGTDVRWQQTLDTAEHYQHIAGFVATAHVQNLEHLAAEDHHTLAPDVQR